MFNKALRGPDLRSQSANDEALLLSPTVRVSEAALRLELYPPQIYDWRQRSVNSQVEVDQAAEIAQLSRHTAE